MEEEEEEDMPGSGLCRDTPAMSIPRKRGYRE
jgi:hypothetical protein